MRMASKWYRYFPALSLVVLGVMIALYILRPAEFALYGNSEGTERMVTAFTSVFAHIDGDHLLGNAISIALLAPIVEIALGRAALLVVLGISALDGLLFEHGYRNTMGASGAVYMLLGLAGVALMAKAWPGIRRGEDREIMMGFGRGAALLSSMAIVIEIAVSRNGGIENINHAAHIRGWLWGVIFGLAVFGTRCIIELRADNKRRAMIRARIHAQRVHLGLPGY